MSYAHASPYCPLYNSAIAAQAWKAETGHSGLIFDKFADAWRKTSSGKPEFDKGVDKNKSSAGEWLRRFTGYHGDREQLQSASQRQRELVAAIGGRSVAISNKSRFITGMGRQHPLENGFTWHHTLGTPYLPGSSLKGMFRSWLREEEGVWLQDRFDETRDNKSLFGALSVIGDLIVFDMIPLNPVQLVVEIMTPHFGDYYQNDQGNTLPGDWLKPVPIAFLAVETNQTWQLGIAPRKSIKRSNDDLISLLLDGFQEMGVGAKTNIGMGRFKRSSAAEEQVARADATVKAQRERDALEAAESAAFSAELATTSLALRELRHQHREQQWRAEAGDARMVAALESFAAHHDIIPDDCLIWLRDLLESIPNYKGVWTKPDETKGKKKKPKYGSVKIRELVKKLNPDLRK